MTAMINRGGLLPLPNRQTRGQNCGSLASNRCKSVKLRPTRARWSLSASRCDFYGRRIFVARSELYSKRGSYRALSIRAQALGIIGNTHKWWEKGIQPNMKEVGSAQDLVDSLKNAGDKLVVVDFFSPGCGGCRALHPKICQIAGTNPDVQFLQVNYEEHKPMCYSLNVHVLPFFRFYRGAEGRVCSFSCTNATIKKFRDALEKHVPERCGLAPPKGLEEKELIALSANKDVSFNYTPTTTTITTKDQANDSLPLPLSFPLTASPLLQGPDTQNKINMVNSGR